MSTPAYTAQTLPLAQIHVHDAIQPRTGLTHAVVEEYATLYAEAEDSEPLPPLDVFQIEHRYYVADGFHRFAAAQKAKRTELSCHVYTGSQAEAARHAAFANLRRGLAYSQHDRQRILERLLQDPEVSQRSNRDLAQVLGLSHVTVGRARHRLATLASLEAEWQALPPPQTKAPEVEQTAAFLGIDPAVVRQYTKRRRDNASFLYPNVLTVVARSMTDEGEDEATAKATLAHRITWDVAHHDQEKARRQAQRAPKAQPKLETPEARARREAEQERAQREDRLLQAFRSLLIDLDEEGSQPWRPRYTLAEMVQAVRPERREELQALLQQTGALVQTLLETVSASQCPTPTPLPAAPALPEGMKQCQKGHDPYPASKPACPMCVRLRGRAAKQRKKAQGPL